MKEFLIIGYKPGTSGLPRYETPTFRQLLSLLGLSIETFERHFAFINASEGRDRVIAAMNEYPYAIFLGNAAARELWLDCQLIDYFTEFSLWDCLGVAATGYMSPHPSGKNRWWNSETNRAAASKWYAEISRRATL